MSQNSSGFPTGKELVITYIEILDSGDTHDERIIFKRGENGVKELAVRRTADIPPALLWCRWNMKTGRRSTSSDSLNSTLKKQRSPPLSLHVF